MADPVVTKARELVAKGEKKLASWFASFSGNKYEDAEELFKKAANQFKVAKSCALCCLRCSAPALLTACARLRVRYSRSPPPTDTQLRAPLPPCERTLSLSRCGRG